MTIASLLLLFSCITATVSDNNPVEVAEGLLYGQSLMVGSDEIVSYLGVPFAKPPLGKLRFAPPLPADKYKKPFWAKHLAPACYQEKDGFFPGFRGSEMWNSDNVTEDCLYLNIWAPRKGRDLHTLVWIFGGGFYSGSPSLDIYNGEILAAKQQVIVVNINYRLGPFGFLYLNNSEAPGNMGLLDQQLALRWVADNIEAFGGSRAKVTLFGESAGSCSGSAHLFAPDSWDLFSNLIVQSGTINMAACHNSPQQALRYSIQLASDLGCNDTKQMAECLRNTPAYLLSRLQHNINTDGFFDPAFSPITSDKNFFKGDFQVKLAQGDFKKTPILLGTITDEGSFWLPYYIGDFIKIDRLNVVDRQQYLEAIRQMFPEANEIQLRAIAFQYSRYQQCPTVPSANSTLYRDALNHVFGDFHFACEVIEFANITAKHGTKVYQYNIDQRIGTNPWPQWMGTMHGYEIEFIFGVPLNGRNHSKDDINMARKLMRIWHRFATYGQPAVRPEEFPRFNHKGQYVVLTANNNLHREMLKSEDCHFWSLIRTPFTLPQTQSDMGTSEVYNARKPQTNQLSSNNEVQLKIIAVQSGCHSQELINGLCLGFSLFFMWF